MEINDSTTISFSLFVIPVIISALFTIIYRFLSNKFGVSLRIDKMESKYDDHFTEHKILESRVFQLEKSHNDFNIFMAEMRITMGFIKETLEDIKKNYENKK